MTIQVTAEGRLTAQPEVRFSQAGKPWATGTIVSNERRQNKQTQEWEDANTTFLRFKMFGAQSEALANLSKGELVVASGKLVQNDWEDKDGNKRQSVEMIVSTIGTVVRNQPQGQRGTPAGGTGAASWGDSQSSGAQAAGGAQGAAWAKPQDDWDRGYAPGYTHDETPF